MSAKNWGYLAVAIAVIVALVIIADIYYVKPNYELKLAKAKRVSTQKSKTVSVKGDITSTSKKIITTRYPEKSASDVEKQAFYRNPFLWPGELKPVVPKKKGPAKAPVLGMICVSDDQKLALINNTPVHEGSELGGHKVEKIEPKYVILSGRYGKMKVSVPEASFGPCEVEMLSHSSSGSLDAGGLADDIKSSSQTEAGVPSLIEKFKSLYKKK